MPSAIELLTEYVPFNCIPSILSINLFVNPVGIQQFTRLLGEYADADRCKPASEPPCHLQHVGTAWVKKSTSTEIAVSAL
jgi:hypothetical protein